MSTKKEEAKAFEKLKKAFPGENVSLDCLHDSWILKPHYKVYVASNEVHPYCFENGQTADETVNKTIARKEVLYQETKDAKEKATNPKPIF